MVVCRFERRTEVIPSIRSLNFLISPELSSGLNACVPCADICFLSFMLFRILLSATGQCIPRCRGRGDEAVHVHVARLRAAPLATWRAKAATSFFSREKTIGRARRLRRAGTAAHG